MKYRVKTLEELSEYPLDDNSFVHARNSFVEDMRVYCGVELEQHEANALMSTKNCGVTIPRLNSWYFSSWMITPIKEDKNLLLLCL